MAEPWEAAPVVEDAEPWAAAPIVGGDGPRGVGAIPRGDDVAPPAQSVARVSRVTSVPGRTAPPAAPATLMDRIGAGVQAGLNMAAGFVGGAVGMPYGAAEAVGINVENMVRGRPERVGLEDQMVKRTQKFTPELPQALQSDLGREYTQDLGEDIAYQAQAIPGIGQPITIAARGAAGIAEGARATRRGIGDTLRADVDRGVQTITPAMSPEKLAMAGKAVDAGIPLRPDMLGENKLVKIAGEGAEHIPFTGGPAQRNKRQIAFNQGLLKEIDPEATAERITPDVYDAALTKAGETIGEISGRTPVPFENVPDLMGVAKHETPDVQGVIRSYAEDIQLLADQNSGVIDGTAFRKINSEIGAQMRRTPNGDLKNALSNLQKRLHDALVESAAPEDIPTLIDARRRYAIAKTLEPLVAKSIDGNISPAALMGRVTADKAGKTRMARGKGGSLGEYAQIGQMFLKEQPTSMTAERNLAYRLATDAAAAAKATAAYLPALAYNLLGPKVAKRMVDSARRRDAAPDGGMPPEPTLGAGFEDVPQGRPGARPNPNDGPLGDLTPDLETAPGAAATDPAVWRNNREAGPVEVQPREPGLNRAIDEPQAESPPGMRTLRPDEYPAPAQDGIPFDAEPALRGVQPPDWETAPGARAAADPLELVPTEGLVRAVDDPNDTSPMRRQRTVDMPVVPGLPGIDDVVVAGRDPVPFVDIKPGALDRLAQRPAGEGGPPPPAPPAAPTPPKPSGPARIEWPDLNSAEMKKWRQENGLGADDAARAVEVGKALQIDSKAVEAAAIQHEKNPRRFDAEVAKIIEKDASNAPETEPPAPSRQEPAPTPKGRGADSETATQGAAKPARPDSAPAPRPNEGSVAPPPAAPARRSAASWAQEMADLQKVKPRPINKLFGTKGPTPEQAAAHADQMKVWNAKYRKASAEQKKALALDNAEFQSRQQQGEQDGQVVSRDVQERRDGADDLQQKDRGQDGPEGQGKAADEGQKGDAPEVDEPEPPPPGTYSTRTGPVTTRKQPLGHVGPVKTMQDAANALAYLHKSAVERFDALVTDAAGNPLAIVGGFKGALTQTSVYPSTIAAEVAQIPRAANLWMVHNHPSGVSRLSRADEHLARNIAGVFEGTKVKVRSIIAVADETWNGGDIASRFDDSESGVVKPVAEGKGPTVPARERQVLETGKLGPTIESPRQAKDAIQKAIADNNGESVVMLLDAQHKPVAIVPWSAADAKPLKDNGKLDALYRAVAHANAGAALIGKGRGMTDAQALNLGKGLQNLDVRSLDIIDANGKSAAEAGLPTAGSQLFSESARDTLQAESVSLDSFGWYEKDDGYVYHVTSAPAAERILEHGFAKNPQRMFTAGFYAANSKDKTFFTDRSGVKFWQEKVENSLFDKYDDPPDVAVIRIPKSQLEGRLQPDNMGSEDAKHPAYFVRTDKDISSFSQGLDTKPIGTPQALDTVLRARFGDKLIQGLVDQGVLKLALAADEGMTGARGRVKAVMRETVDRQPAATLFADRLSADQAPRVLMHELGEHFGIVRLLGDGRYKVLLDELQAARKQPEVAEAWQHVKDNYTSTDSASRLKENEPRFLREVAARLVEEHPDLPWVRRLINEIRAFFYENFGTTMGNRVDADLIRGLAAAALRKASKGELDRMRTPVRMLDGAPVKRRSPETQFDSRAQ